MISDIKSKHYYDFRIEFIDLLESCNPIEFLELLLTQESSKKCPNICFDIDNKKFIIKNDANNFFSIKMSDTNYKTIHYLFGVAGDKLGQILFDSYTKRAYEKLEEVSNCLVDNDFSEIESLISEGYITINQLNELELNSFLINAPFDPISNGVISDIKSFNYLIEHITNIRSPYDLMMLIDYNIDIVSINMDIELYIISIANSLKQSPKVFDSYKNKLINNFYNSTYIREYYDQDFNKINNFGEKLEFILSKKD